MLGHRERIAEKFIPKEFSYIAQSLAEKGRNVQIVERVWGGNQANGSYFGGHDRILVEVLGSFPWQRRDLMHEDGFFPFRIEFKYRPEDKILSDIVDEAKERFPDTSFSDSEYSPKDEGFFSWLFYNS